MRELDQDMDVCYIIITLSLPKCKKKLMTELLHKNVCLGRHAMPPRSPHPPPEHGEPWARWQRNILEDDAKGCVGCKGCVSDPDPGTSSIQLPSSCQP